MYLALEDNYTKYVFPPLVPHSWKKRNSLKTLKNISYLSLMPLLHSVKLWGMTLGKEFWDCQILIEKRDVLMCQNVSSLKVDIIVWYVATKKLVIVIWKCLATPTFVPLLLYHWIWNHQSEMFTLGFLYFPGERESW